jgi:hypothetical protein
MHQTKLGCSSFNQAKEALAYLEKGNAKGKVVVQIS